MKRGPWLAIEVPATEARRDEVEARTFEQLDAITAALAVPASPARRERIEDAVLARVATLRLAERADSYVEPRRVFRPWMLAATAAAAAAIAIVTVALKDPAPPAATLATTSRVVTPVGGASRFTVGDAVIDAGSDTSVEVTREPSGAVTLVLARGIVDCDVEHKPDRAPFLVAAGDVTVRVVGTRFSVARSTDAVRVDVARGKVHVIAPGLERFVATGETWSSGAVAIVPPTPAPIDPAPPAPSPHAVADDPAIEVLPPPPPAAQDKPAVKPLATKATYEEAQRLEARDRAGAARAYRKVANGQGTWAALALWGLAELEAGRGSAGARAALAAVAEYLRRFPDGANAEDAAWLRVEVSRTTKDKAGAREAAIDYLQRFPTGTYAKPAQRIANAPP